MLPGSCYPLNCDQALPGVLLTAYQHWWPPAGLWAGVLDVWLISTGVTKGAEAQSQLAVASSLRPGGYTAEKRCIFAFIPTCPIWLIMDDKWGTRETEVRTGEDLLVNTGFFLTACLFSGVASFIMHLFHLSCMRGLPGGRKGILSFLFPIPPISAWPPALSRALQEINCIMDGFQGQLRRQVLEPMRALLTLGNPQRWGCPLMTFPHPALAVWALTAEGFLFSRITLPPSALASRCLCHSAAKGELTLVEQWCSIWDG